MLSAYCRRDPSVKACDSIIGEVVQEFAGQVVRSVVEEKVVGHMAVIKAGDWLEDFILETIEPMIPVVVRILFRTSTLISKSLLVCFFVSLFLFISKFFFFHSTLKQYSCGFLMRAN